MVKSRNEPNMIVYVQGFCIPRAYVRASLLCPLAGADPARCYTHKRENRIALGCSESLVSRKAETPTPSAPYAGKCSR